MISFILFLLLFLIKTSYQSEPLSKMRQCRKSPDRFVGGLGIKWQFVKQSFTCMMFV